MGTLLSSGKGLGLSKMKAPHGDEWVPFCLPALDLTSTIAGPELAANTVCGMN